MVMLVQVYYELTRKKFTLMYEQFPTVAIHVAIFMYTTHTIKSDYIWDLIDLKKKKDLTEV